MTDAMMKPLGEANGVSWYWAAPGQFDNPGVYYWDGTRNVLCVPYRAPTPPPAPAQASEVAELTNEQILDIWDKHTVPVFGKVGYCPIVFARNLIAALRASTPERVPLKDGGAP